MPAASKIRFGHAINEEAGEGLEGVVRRGLELIQGSRQLLARELKEHEVVYRAERLMGYSEGNRPIYAYVGDIHPALGVVGLVIERDWPVQSASRCDTGGLISGKGYFSAVEDSLQEQALRELTFSPPGVGWEEAFAQEMEQVHGGVEHYVRGKCPDPALFSDGDVRAHCVAHGKSSGDSPIDRRCWTWEVRGSQAPRKEAYRALVLTTIAQEKYAQILDRDPAVDVVDIPILAAEDDPTGIAGRWCRPEELYAFMFGEEGVGE